MTISDPYSSFFLMIIYFIPSYVFLINLHGLVSSFSCSLSYFLCFQVDGFEQKFSLFGIYMIVLSKYIKSYLNMDSKMMTTIINFLP